VVVAHGKHKEPIRRNVTDDDECSKSYWDDSGKEGKTFDNMWRSRALSHTTRFTDKRVRAPGEVGSVKSGVPVKKRGCLNGMWKGADLFERGLKVLGGKKMEGGGGQTGKHGMDRMPCLLSH